MSDKNNIDSQNYLFTDPSTWVATPVDASKPVEAGDNLRKDFGKVRFDLLPPEALFALADLYTQGAKKYQDRGWEEGMDWSRCFGSLMRHGWKWLRGEDVDEETGAHHMIAVAWNAFALYTYSVRKKGKDDRPGK